MTVAGLWSLLRRRGLVQDLGGAEARDFLEGKKVAIDISAWTVQGSTLEAALGTTRCRHFLAVSFWRLSRCLRVGCFPLAVLEGHCPSAKRRRRQADGDFQRDIELVGELFVAMGCPTVRAPSEAEGGCAQLSQAGVVDAIESPDSDVFPFGACGHVLKAVDSGGDAWRMEVVDVQASSDSVGLGSWIALAALAGCDFSLAGAKGVGIEKGSQCITAMLRHCGGEAGLKDWLLAALDGGLPPELRGLVSLVGCSTCRRCGHGTVGKLQHGNLGCDECGTTKAQGGVGGCLARVGPCPCKFYQLHDEVVLAKTFESRTALPHASAVRSVFRVYGEDPALEHMYVAWKRPGLDAVSRLLSDQCGVSRQATVKYALPAVLVWDLLHPEDPDAQFAPSAVCGQCSVGLLAPEKGVRSNLLVALQWGAIPGREVCETLLRLSNELPRAKRSVTKRLALRCCPALIEEHCRAELAKKAGSSALRVGLKTREHLVSEARAVCCEDWGLPNAPGQIIDDIEGRVASWNGEKRASKKQRTLSALVGAQLALQ